MNIELLQQIKARILAEPDAFRMDVWSCGTAHCIAGWACVLSGQRVVNPDEPAPYLQRLENGDPPPVFASRQLGLPARGSWLFDTAAWPDDFEERYFDTDDRAQQAAIAAEVIDRFIEREGRDFDGD